MTATTDIILSDRQHAIMAYIPAYIKRHGYPPTIREIGKACGISSTSVVVYNLNRLTEDGLIERVPVVSRGIRVVEL